MISFMVGVARHSYGYKVFVSSDTQTTGSVSMFKFSHLMVFGFWLSF